MFSLTALKRKKRSLNINLYFFSFFFLIFLIFLISPCCPTVTRPEEGRLVCLLRQGRLSKRGGALAWGGLGQLALLLKLLLTRKLCPVRLLLLKKCTVELRLLMLRCSVLGLGGAVLSLGLVLLVLLVLEVHLPARWVILKAAEEGSSVARPCRTGGDLLMLAEHVQILLLLLDTLLLLLLSLSIVARHSRRRLGLHGAKAAGHRLLRRLRDPLGVIDTLLGHRRWVPRVGALGRGGHPRPYTAFARRWAGCQGGGKVAGPLSAGSAVLVHTETLLLLHHMLATLGFLKGTALRGKSFSLPLGDRGPLLVRPLRCSLHHTLL